MKSDLTFGMRDVLAFSPTPARHVSRQPEISPRSYSREAIPDFAGCFESREQLEDYIDTFLEDASAPKIQQEMGRMFNYARQKGQLPLLLRIFADTAFPCPIDELREPLLKLLSARQEDLRLFGAALQVYLRHTSVGRRCDRIETFEGYDALDARQRRMAATIFALVRPTQLP